MSHLPPDIRHDLMRRMLSLKPVVEDAMGIIEKTMHEDCMTNFLAWNLVDPDTYPRMAEASSIEDGADGSRWSNR